MKNSILLAICKLLSIIMTLSSLKVSMRQAQKECEGLSTSAECFESLKTMAPNKCPGTGGLPAEFYEVFWKDIE